MHRVFGQALKLKPRKNLIIWIIGLKDECAEAIVDPDASPYVSSSYALHKKLREWFKKKLQDS